MSDNDHDSDSDAEDCGSKKSGKPVPSWAQKDALESALRRQFGDAPVNPDDIFGEVFSCDLEGVCACACARTDYVLCR